MNGIRFDGLSTGLETSALIDALLNLERRPLGLLESRQANLEAQQSLFRGLNTSLLALRDAARALDNQNDLLSGESLDEEFLAFDVSSSEPGIVTAEATGNATPGNLQVRVDAIAEIGRRFSQGFSAVDTAVAASGDSLEIDFGGAAPISIVVGQAGSTLGELKNLVNDAPDNDGKVRAEIVFDGTVHRLMLSGTQTGAANDLSVTTTIAGPAGSPFVDPTLSQSASDARIEVLGIAVTSPDNVVTGALPGVTLRLHSAHDPANASARASLDVGRDDEAIEAKVQALVDAYNVVRDFAIEQSTFNEGLGRAGLLSGDSTLRGIERQVQRALGSAYSFAGSALSSLAEIGVSFDRDSRLELDSAELRSALDRDAQGVRRLLSGDGTSEGAAAALALLIDPITKDDGGVLAIRDEGFESRLDALDRSIENMERRLELREEGLVLQFSRLEALVSGLQAQAGFLTSLGIARSRDA